MSDTFVRHGSGSIVTPEAVVLDFDLAGIGSRSLAVAIDVAIQFVALFALLLMSGIVGAGNSVVGIVILLVGLIAVFFGYPIVAETRFNGRSVGRRVVGTRVVTVEGAPVRFRHATIRAFLAIIDLYVSAGAVAVIAALTTRRGQRLGDLVAGTMVVREPKKGSALWYEPIMAAPHLAGWARDMDTSALGDDGYQLVRDFLRRDDLADRETSELAREIETIVNERLPLWPRPTGTTLIDYLRTIAARAQQIGATPPPPPSGPAVRVSPPPPSFQPPPPGFQPPPPPGPRPGFQPPPPTTLPVALPAPSLSGPVDAPGRLPERTAPPNDGGFAAPG